MIEDVKVTDYELGFLHDQVLKELDKIEPFYNDADQHTKEIIHAVYRVAFTDGFNTCLDETKGRIAEAYNRGYDEGVQVDPRYWEEFDD